MNTERLVGSQVTYAIQIATSSQRGSGTHANIWIDLCGEFGDTGEVFLRTDMTSAGKNPFAQGKTSSFDIEWPDLGEIRKVRVGHDGSGHAWQCEKITVRNMAKATRWEFPCGEWFGNMAGHKLERDVKAGGGGVRGGGGGGAGGGGSGHRGSDYSNESWDPHT